jgi:hypothetical protein
MANRGASAAFTPKSSLIHKFGRVAFHGSGAIAPNLNHTLNAA